MQISGVNLTLTCPWRLCLLRVLLSVRHCYKLSPFQAHWGMRHCTHFLWPACLFTAHVGSGSSSLSCGVFLPLPLLLAFPLLLAGHVLLLLPDGMFIYSSCGRWVLPPLLWSFPPFATLTNFPTPGCWAHTPAPVRASPARPGLFIYSSGKDFPPCTSVFSAPHPLCNVSLLFLLLITQFLFFPQVEVGLSRGLCSSGPGLSVGVPCTS
jgi:hypothetical protein